MGLFRTAKTYITNLAAVARGGVSISTIRQTMPSEYTSTLVSALLPRKYAEFHDKDLTDLSKWDHKNILKILRAVSPEASQAVSTYLRIFDSGFRYSVKKTDGSLHQSATDALLKLVGQLEATDIRAGFSLPNKLNDLSQRFALDCLFKGAIAGEMVFDKDLRVQSIQYVDPWSIDFVWDKDLMKYVPYQWQVGVRRKLDIPNFFYIPVDPLGEDPYGEEQITPAIQAIIFKAMVLQDLRMAIHMNGWDRLDFSILDNAIRANIPLTERNDPAAAKKYYDAAISEITTMYKGLKPDDNIVHTDNIKVSPVRGTMGGGKFDPKPLLDVLDNQIANALKTFQVILSKKFGGGSEGFTSSEMVLYVKLVGGYQNIVENFWERALSLALRVQSGLLVDVDFSYYKPELRTDTEIAQYIAVAIANVNSSYASGAIGQNERIGRIREIGGYEGPVPNDLNPNPVTTMPTEPNQPERPPSSEPGKEEKRKETNRSRRSGRRQLETETSLF